MIYRFVVCYVLGSFGLMMLLATALIGGLGHFGPRRTATIAFWPSIVTAALRGRVLVLLVLGLLAMSAYFLWPGVVELTTTGHVTLHWSRLLAGAFTLFSALQTSVFALLIEVVSLWRRQQMQQIELETIGVRGQPSTTRARLKESASTRDSQDGV
jgi:hypothetical protein